MFGEPQAFSDVDRSGTGEDAAAYLSAMAEIERASREEALGLLDLRPGSVFLDAGCGLGEVVTDVSARVTPGGYAVGVDLSAELIRMARDQAVARGAAAARFEVGNVQDLPFEDATYDAVRCERVLQHLDDGEACAAVAEFVRVAKSGGRIQLVDPVHAQHVVDCKDVALFESVIRRLMVSARDPYSGIRLARRLHEANTTVVSFDAVARRIPNLSVWRQALGVDQHLQALVQAGDVAKVRAEAFWDDLADRDASGDFYAVTVVYRATALKER